MRKAITLPELGLPAGRRVTLSAWFALPGEPVLEGEQLVEVLTEGATFDVASPVTGWLIERLAFPHDELQPGQVLGVVEAMSEE
jgi:pyruvate/2-oxoglutarate dehydrogenase complex dihydrolipoamide acyltransferase (E2) component